MWTKTLAVTKKELRIYFSTVVGYAGFGIFAFLMGLLFVTTLNQYQAQTAQLVALKRPELLARLNFNDAIITPMLSSGLWMFMFFIPFLTMRLLAEEKQNRTFELLMTTPISSLHIVLGKFFAVTFMVACLVVIPLIFPLILHVYGSGTGTQSGVEWAPVFTAVAMIFLLGATFAALGLLVSSFTENQVVAALVTFAGLLVCFVLPMLAQRLEGPARTLLGYLSPIAHVRGALQGRLPLSDLAYFVSVIGGLLFATLRSVESHRWRA